MSAQAMTDVFISFSSADASSALELCQGIEAHGLHCFFAPRDIPSGSNFAIEIVEAITRSSALVVLVSDSSVSSPHVRREVSLAIDERCPVIPLSLFKTMNTLPLDWRYWLSAVQMVPFENGEAAAKGVVICLDRFGNRSVTAEFKQHETVAEDSREQDQTTQSVNGVAISETSPDCDVPPSALLRADAAATDFVGREEETTRLRTWMERDSRFLTRLIVGPGGSGKTRSALEVCGWASARGWVTSFVEPDTAGFGGVYGGDNPTLFVLDYAETRSRVLRELIDRLRSSPSPKVRLLLLARSDGDWWTSLLLESPELEAVLTTSPTLVLRPLGETSDLAAQVYESACRSFCNRLGVSETQFRSRRQFNIDMTALDLQTVALLDVLEVRRSLEPETAQSPAERLLNHERRYLKAAVAGDGIEGLETTDLDRILAVIALLGASTEREALENLNRVDTSLDGAKRKKLVRLLRRLYPPRHGSYLSGIKPDVIAEELISQVVAGSGRPSETLDFPSEILRGLTIPQLERGLTMLGRSASRVHVREAIFALLDGLPEDTTVAAIHVATRLEDPSPIVDAVRHGIASGKLERDVIELLLREVPDETLALADVAADLCTQLIRMNRLRADDSEAAADAARFLCEASNRLSDVGRTAEAVATVREAVETYRTLPRSNPVVIELGASLSSLSNRLWEAGDSASALPPAEEAVALLSSVDAPSSEQIRSRKVTAAALNNLAFRQADLGAFESGCQSAQEAVALFRALNDVRDFFVRSGTASALNNLASINNALGRFEQAIKAADECVERRRTQALEDRDRFLPYLARALSNAAIAHLGSGDERGALELGEEGIDLQLIISQSRPVFTWELAMSGLNIATIHISCGHNSQASDVITWVLNEAYRHPNIRLPEPRVTQTLEKMRDGLQAGQVRSDCPILALNGWSASLLEGVPFGLVLEYKDL